MGRKHYLLLALAIFIAIAVCVNCAVFADFSFGMKICFGIAAAILYVLLHLIPYFMMRRKDAELSLQSYLKRYIYEIITED